MKKRGSMAALFACMKPGSALDRGELDFHATVLGAAGLGIVGGDWVLLAATGDREALLYDALIGQDVATAIARLRDSSRL